MANVMVHLKVRGKDVSLKKKKIVKSYYYYYYFIKPYLLLF